MEESSFLNEEEIFFNKPLPQPLPLDEPTDILQ